MELKKIKSVEDLKDNTNNILLELDYLYSNVLDVKKETIKLQQDFIQLKIDKEKDLKEIADLLTATLTENKVNHLTKINK